MSGLSRCTSRPFPAVGLAALLVVAMTALSACSSPSPKPTKATTKATVAPTTKAVAKPSPFTAKGMPAELAAVIKPLYYGGAVRSSPAVSKVLQKRKVVKAGGQVVASGAVSTFKGVPIAVVTRGKDVTLAVKAPRWKVVGGWWPSVAVSSPSLGGGPRRVLVLGSDARPGQNVDRARADSVHIVGFDGHGRGGILGIPRDTYVPLSTGGRGKLNSALAFGGPAAMQQTVASATGVPLDGYLITGFMGFKLLIHGIGGLKINIPVSVKDSGSHVNVKAGPNQLTGAQALAYGRARKAVAGGDFGRSANQGLIIRAVANVTRAAGPKRLPAILAAAAPKLGTNMSAEQVLTFAAGAYTTPSARVPNKVATGGFGMTSDGQSIVLVQDSARRLFADMRNGNLR